MVLDPITMLLMVRESYAQQRRDLLTENCARDAVTGQLLVSTFNMEAWDGLCEIDRWLEQIDATLIAQGTDPQPAPEPESSNVIQFPVARVRSGAWHGSAA